MIISGCGNQEEPGGPCSFFGSRQTFPIVTHRFRKLFADVPRTPESNSFQLPLLDLYGNGGLRIVIVDTDKYTSEHERASAMYLKLDRFYLYELY